VAVLNPKGEKDMTVASETARCEYIGNSVTVDFTIDFYFLIDADVRVVLYNSVTDTETELTETTHYTIVGAGEAAGGMLTMVTAPTSDETLTILRDLSYTQERDYIEHSTFPAESHEQALDRVTMLQQQLNEKFIRTIRFKPSASEKNIKMKPMVASSAVVTNETADGFEMGPTVNEISNAQTYANDAETAKIAAEIAAEQLEEWAQSNINNYANSPMIAPWL